MLSLFHIYVNETKIAANLVTVAHKPKETCKQVLAVCEPETLGLKARSDRPR